MTSLITIFIACLLTTQVLAWEALPNIPTGRRSQFLVLRDDGAYKFGYDTGDGNAAKQEGDASNQVKGHYFYKNGAGKEFDLKYTSGVQGFVPENLDKIQAFIKSSAPGGPSASYLPAIPSISYLPAAQTYSSSYEGDDNSGTYSPDDSGEYKPDNSGDYNPENSGESNPEDSGDSNPEVSGENNPDDSGEYKPDNSGDYNNSEESSSGDASYNFNVDTAAYKRTESSDAGGNVQGSYSYSNNAGTHDLQYVAGAGTGFVARSGSLSKANGLTGAAAQIAGGRSFAGAAYSSGVGPKGPLNPDGSYAFSYSTGDQSREESGDASGNVRGRFAYNNAAGSHDLSYQAGSATGFLVTGGSLAKPGVGAGAAGGYVSGGYQAQAGSSAAFKSGAGPKGPINPDGSYAFSYSTGDQSREESGDASGNVRGRFAYNNAAGNHDLSYQAGSATGFLVTGGSLAKPGAGAGAAGGYARGGYQAQAGSSAAFKSSSSGSDDGSYSFGYSLGDQDRHEESDASGNVRGRFSYRNNAGNHDLSYVAGSATGFLPTGGSLATPNGLGGGGGAAVASSQSSAAGYSYNAAGGYSEGGSEDDQADTGDSSYNFNIDTPEYKRHESSDARGNVRGSYSYVNKAGTNDLSYVAGSATGFQATGGSLSVPNGLAGKAALSATNTYLPPAPLNSDSVEIAAAKSGEYSNSEASSGDASYNFAFDTDEYKRQEASDASGNVRGSFTYKNSVGNHDLSFVAGSGTGFRASGGSLAIVPGASESQLRAGFRSGGSSRFSSFVSGSNDSYESQARSAPHTKASYTLGNVKVHTYLPPSNEKHKFGYIFDTQ